MASPTDSNLSNMNHLLHRRTATFGGLKSFHFGRKPKLSLVVDQNEQQPGSSNKATKSESVSRDDTLVVRGANPRTGLVSPQVASMTSGECSDLVARRPEIVRGHSRGAQSWHQSESGWNLVDPGQVTSRTLRNGSMASMRPTVARSQWEARGSISSKAASTARTASGPGQAPGFPSQPSTKADDATVIINIPRTDDSRADSLVLEHVERYQHSVTQAARAAKRRHEHFCAS